MKKRNAHALLVTLIITELLVIATSATLLIIFNYNIGINNEIEKLREIVNPSSSCVFNIIRGLIR